MNEAKKEYIEKLYQTGAIIYKVVDASPHIKPNTKNNFIYYTSQWMDRLETEQFTITQFKQIENSLLSYWRESIGVDTELFWLELRKSNIDFERRDELVFTLNKGRFRNVGIGMLARKQWTLIRDSESIKYRFTDDERNKIDKIIELDEKTRLAMLTKCLRRKDIPQSGYLKFGECMAYFEQCGLFSKYFSTEEVVELDKIWSNFRSK